MSNLVSAATAVEPEMQAQVQSDYGKPPLSFEANQGQTDSKVKFLARGHGYALFLTPSEAVLSLMKPQVQHKAASPVKFSPLPKSDRAVLRMQLVGANSAPQVLGKEELPGQVNYLIGNDPSQWLTGVPTYGKVAYEGVYPGVDLVYYGNEGQLEYDFVVAPGADPHQVKLAFQGADNIEVNSAEELVVHSANGEIHMHKPVLYQEIDGVRKSIEGSYVLEDDQSVGFQVAAYDASRPLIIDPVLVYSTFLGGGDNDTGFGIAVDQRGQAYVMGFTCSDFPTKNPLQPDFGGPNCESGDAFVTKFTANGRALVYSTYFGGSQHDQGTGIAVDRLGQVYVTGLTESLDFPTRNAFQSDHGGDIDSGLNNDAFVAQISADGRSLRYSTYLGGSDNDRGSRVAVDALGRLTVTGSTGSSDFPTRNALQLSLEGSSDAFVAQFTANGRALRYSTYLGGRGSDGASGVAVDARGQVIVAGTTSSSDFPTRNALQSNLRGSSDAFVAQFTASGRALRYSTYLGGRRSDRGSDVAVDRQGRAYVIGTTQSPNFPVKSAPQSALGGGSDVFVAQLKADGKTLGYATYLGGDSDDIGESIAVDTLGQAYVTGDTHSFDFPTTARAFQPVVTLGPPFSAFVTKIGIAR